MIVVPFDAFLMGITLIVGGVLYIGKYTDIDHMKYLFKQNIKNLWGTDVECDVKPYSWFEWLCQQRLSDAKKSIKNYEIIIRRRNKDGHYAKSETRNRKRRAKGQG